MGVQLLATARIHTTFIFTLPPIRENVESHGMGVARIVPERQTGFKLYCFKEEPPRQSDTVFIKMHYLYGSMHHHSL